MTYTQKILTAQEGQAAKMFRHRSYAERSLPKKLIAVLLSVLFPICSVAFGTYYLVSLTELHMWIALPAFGLVLALTETVKATCIRSTVRSILQHSPSWMDMLAVCLATALTAYLAAQGASMMYTSSRQQSDGITQELSKMDEARGKELAAIAEQAAAITALKWPTTHDRHTLRMLVQQQQQVGERYDKIRASIEQKAGKQQADTDSVAQDVWAMLLLIELAILACHSYTVVYYWKVWKEGKDTSTTSLADTATDDDTAAFLRTAMERRQVAPAASTQTSIGFQIPEMDKERRFFHLWQAGNRNPMFFTKELRISLQQYKSIKEKLKLA